MMPQQNAKGSEPPAREIASARKNITDQDRQLAISALADFKAKRYDTALQVLRKLSDLRPHDARVAYNRAVVEYYFSNLSKTDDFIKQMNGAKKQLEFGMVNTGDELDDIDRSFLLYNEAVLNFHVEKHKAAMDVLERLFKIIEPLDDSLAIRVCMLLTELYLQSEQLDPAQGMISYLETVMFSPKGAQDGKMEDESRMKEHQELTEVLKPKLHMFKVRIFLQRRFLAQCKRELKLAMNSNNNSCEALFLKGNLEYLRGNYPKAIKLLNSAPKAAGVAECGHALAVLYYSNMTCIHFAMGKYTLALLYSRKALEENINVMKSLPAIEKFTLQSGRPLLTLSVNKRSEIVYNMGVSLLFAGKPTPAFECLMEAQNAYQCNPRFWLRLAECCVAVCEQLRGEQQSSRSKKSEYVRGVVGTGLNRKVVLAPLRDHLKQPSQEGQSAAMPSASLEFANICLYNAALLLPKDADLEAAMEKYLQSVAQGNAGMTGDKEEGKKMQPGQISVEAPPGRPIHTVEAYNMRLSVLACHAYIALGLGDYSKSLDFTQSMLKMKFAPAPIKFLARMYRAESLIKLDKISEAIQDLAADNWATADSSAFDQEAGSMKSLKPFPKSLAEARAVMLLNLACAHSLRGDYDKCKQTLRQLVANKIPSPIQSHAVLLAVYCELQAGYVNTALSLIKRGEVFPSIRLIDRVDSTRPMQPAESLSVFSGQQEKRPMPQPIGLPQGFGGFPQAPLRSPFLAPEMKFPPSGAPLGGFQSAPGGSFPPVGSFQAAPGTGFSQAPGDRSGFQQVPGNRGFSSSGMTGNFPSGSVSGFSTPPPAGFASQKSVFGDSLLGGIQRPFL